MERSFPLPGTAPRADSHHCPGCAEADAFEQELVFDEFLRTIGGIDPGHLRDDVYDAMLAQFRAKVFADGATEIRGDSASRIKKIYRRLARKLHPDSTPGGTPEATSLWHETQAAYDTGDLTRLELLLVMAGAEE